MKTCCSGWKVNLAAACMSSGFFLLLPLFLTMGNQAGLSAEALAPFPKRRRRRFWICRQQFDQQNTGENQEAAYILGWGQAFAQMDCSENGGEQTFPRQNDGRIGWGRVALADGLQAKGKGS